MLYVNGANSTAGVLPPGGKTARTARPKSCHRAAADCKSVCVILCLRLSVML